MKREKIMLIRTKVYIIVKKHGNKWVPAKEYGCVGSKYASYFQHRNGWCACGCIEEYSFKDAQEVLSDMKNGDIPGHSRKGRYKIMEVCYCNL